MSISKVPIDNIRIPEVRSNAVYNVEKEGELKQSIIDTGIQYRPLVRQIDFETYELVDGLHRIDIWKELGHTDIEVEIEQLNEEAALIKHIVANHQRGESDPVGLSMIINKLYNGGKSISEIAKMIGYSTSTINSYMPLALLPDEFKRCMTEGTLKISHIREIQKLDTPEDMAAGLSMAVRNQWSASILHHWVANRVAELQINEVRRQQGCPDAITPPPPRAELADMRQCLVCGAHGKSQDMYYPCLGPECHNTLQYLLTLDKNPWHALENVTVQLQHVQEDNLQKDARIKELSDKIIDLTTKMMLSQPVQ